MYASIRLLIMNSGVTDAIALAVGELVPAAGGGEGWGRRKNVFGEEWAARVAAGLAAERRACADGAPRHRATD